MTSTLRLVAALSLLLFSPAMALADTVALYTNPLWDGANNLNLGADVRVGKQVTVGPYGSYGASRSDSDKTDFWGAGLRADFYLSDAAFRSGWYLSPFVSRYQWHVDTGESTDYKAANLRFGATNIGGTAGYVFCGGSSDVKVFVRLGLGLMDSIFDGDSTLTKLDGTTEQDSFARVHGILPTGDIHIGLVF